MVPGLGVRCVLPNPWVTGGETAELALALWAVGESDRAVRLLADMQRLRADDGLYWTGYVFDDDAMWPVERTTWTAGALLLAVAALGGMRRPPPSSGRSDCRTGLRPAAVRPGSEGSPGRHVLLTRPAIACAISM